MCMRDEYLRKIAKAKAEWQTSGTIHRRDLYKYIRRLQKELRRCTSQQRITQKKQTAT